ncbi:MAG: hypothetical protein QOG91_154 [Candidatus Parcubacteria bacterium]|jgi:hypothetical protein|nr:hypothetical protein [Candidatus Parcubacteria bacterium]
MDNKKTTKLTAAAVALCIVWMALHIPGIVYGTSDTPLHVSYMTADEQSPVNGALHILETKNPLELRNITTLYYGPVFALIAIPATILDFAVRLISGAVSGPLSYKDFVVWNWGGILIWGRIIAVISGFTGMWATYLLFKTKTFNPSGAKWLATAAAVMVGLNYLYFEYMNFFRHWAFMLPILIWQIYLLVRIMETERGRAKYWVGQALLTTAIFGISYLSIIFQVIWLPAIVRWVRKKDRIRFRELCWYVLGAAIGMALIVWWYPYGFMRTVSIAGIGAPPANSQGVVLDVPSTGWASGHSFVFYAETILVNDFLLIVAGLILLAAIFSRKRIFAQYWFWVLILPAAANYLLFGDLTHHETRYVLPTLVCLVLLVMALYSAAFAEWRYDRPSARLAGLLLGLSLLLNVVQIAGWERMIIAGPPERRAIVPELIAWQKADPRAKTLAIKNWPFGYVHSAPAYAEYVATHQKSTYDLWNYILTLPPPSNVTPINVYYEPVGSFVTAADKKAYDHIVVWNPASIDSDLADVSPNDEFDWKPWTVWNYSAYQESFKIIK